VRGVLWSSGAAGHLGHIREEIEGEAVGVGGMLLRKNKGAERRTKW